MTPTEYRYLLDQFIEAIFQILINASGKYQFDESLIDKLFELIHYNDDTGIIQCADEIHNRSGKQIDQKALTELALQVAWLKASGHHNEPADKRLEACITAINSSITLFERFEEIEMLYDISVIGYIFTTNLHLPALQFAKKLCLYADKENPVRYHTALWSFAKEQAVESLKNNNDWLQAIDAIELALSLPIPNEKIQEEQVDELYNILKNALDSPVRWLCALLLTIYEPKSINVDIHKLRLKLAGLDNEFINEQGLEIVRSIAMMSAQNDVDNIRMYYIGINKRPVFYLHDFTLFHKNLKGAVPLGKSLIADINRTGEFLLDLVHEVTHAYSMVGTIGKVLNALRVGIHSCEILISSPGNNTEDQLGHITPIEELPDDEYSQSLAWLQLTFVHRVNALESAWRPWLEGIAIYFELLADPSEDENENVIVFEAIRSLIDFYPGTNIKKEEIHKYAIEYANVFDDFCSQALKKLSPLRHIGYLLDLKKNQSNLGVDYFLGYVLVRSVVAQWECTLGGKLKPIKAAKLLLHATRGDGNNDMIPPLDHQLELFSQACNEKFASWVESIASLDKDTIENFIQGVEPTEPGEKFYWKQGKTFPVSSNADEAGKMMIDWVERLNQQLISLMAGAGLPPELNNRINVRLLQHTANKIGDLIEDLTNYYWELLTFLPVGWDEAKLNTADNTTGRVILSPRTYIGQQAKNNEAPAGQRYSPLIFTLPGGITEWESLISIFARQRTTRVSITRIIDLIGKPNNPAKAAATSVVCCFIGEQWQLISFGFLTKILDETHSDFIKLIKNRVFPPIFFSDEINTLSSYMFLQNRISGRLPEIPALFADAIPDPITLSTEFICDLIAKVMASSRQEIDMLVSEIKTNNEIAMDIARLLYQTGIKKEEDLQKVLAPWLNNDLIKILFTNSSFSGIKPFKL